MYAILLLKKLSETIFHNENYFFREIQIATKI